MPMTIPAHMLLVPGVFQNCPPEPSLENAERAKQAAEMCVPYPMQIVQIRPNSPRDPSTIALYLKPAEQGVLAIDCIELCVPRSHPDFERIKTWRPGATVKMQEHDLHDRVMATNPVAHLSMAQA